VGLKVTLIVRDSPAAMLALRTRLPVKLHLVDGGFERVMVSVARRRCSR
jgi:hypothetical protein